MQPISTIDDYVRSWGMQSPIDVIQQPPNLLFRNSVEVDSKTKSISSIRAFATSPDIGQRRRYCELMPSNSIKLITKPTIQNATPRTIRIKKHHDAVVMIIVVMFLPWVLKVQHTISRENNLKESFKTQVRITSIIKDFILQRKEFSLTLNSPRKPLYRFSHNSTPFGVL